MSANLAATLGAVAMVAVLLVAIALGVVDVDFGSGDASNGGGKTTGHSGSADKAYLSEGERAPREFLYLDTARAEAYLSQLKGGNETLRTVSDKTTTKGGGEIGFGGVKVSGEAAREGSVEHTINATTASNFFQLTAALRDVHAIRELSPPNITAPDDNTLRQAAAKVPSSGSFAPADGNGNAEFAREWKKVQEGDIVRFIATIRRPTFVRVYQTLRQVPADSKLGRQGAAVLKKVGNATRMPLAVEARLPRPAATVGPPQPPPLLRLVMPVQPDKLTLEPSLFAPRLTIVAKVVRRVDKARDHYRDFAFYNRFAPVLKLPASARHRLNAPRSRLQAELGRYRNITAPAAVILPIAIYK